MINKLDITHKVEFLEEEDRGAVGIPQLLTRVVEEGADTLQVCPGQPPMMRVGGNLYRMDSDNIVAADIDSWIETSLTGDHHTVLNEKHSVTYTYRIEGLAAWVCVVFKHLGGCSIIFTSIFEKVLSLEDIGAPEALNGLLDLNYGLVLLNGSAGSGIGVTFHALVDGFNKNSDSHILLIEESASISHQSNKAVIHQRQVGNDAYQMEQALLDADKQDVDVIFLDARFDELSPQAMRLAWSLAERGYLLFSSTSARTSEQALVRLSSTLPHLDRADAFHWIALYLRASVSQMLIRRERGGWVALHEILFNTDEVSNVLKTGNLEAVTDHLYQSTSDNAVAMEVSINAQHAVGAVPAEEAFKRVQSVLDELRWRDRYDSIEDWSRQAGMDRNKEAL